MPKREQHKKNWGDDSDESPAIGVEELARRGYGLPEDKRTTPVPDGTIVPLGDGTLSVGGVTLTSVGVDLPDDTPFEQWQTLVRSMLSVGAAAQWCLGDLYIFAEKKEWRETYKALAAEYDYEIATLYTYVWLNRKVKFSIRNRELSPSHHRTVAKFAEQPDLQRWWLEWAATANDGKPVTISQMRQAIKDWEKENSPTLSNGAVPATGQNVLISRENRPNFTKFLKLASRAGQGDKKAKERALGQIAQQRQWLDEVEKWLLEG
jgi:hypothetical protein